MFLPAPGAGLYALGAPADDIVRAAAVRVADGAVYRTTRVPADLFPPREGKPEYLEKTQAWARGPNGEILAGKSGETVGDETGKKKGTYQNYIHQVNECVEALDEGVGKVMAALKESGQLENTLVIYTADQGFGMGEHGHYSVYLLLGVP